jgi:hypothetical protein
MLTLRKIWKQREKEGFSEWSTDGAKRSFVKKKLERKLASSGSTGSNCDQPIGRQDGPHILGQTNGQ